MWERGAAVEGWGPRALSGQRNRAREAGACWTAAGPHPGPPAACRVRSAPAPLPPSSPTGCGGRPAAGAARPAGPRPARRAAAPARPLDLPRWRGGWVSVCRHAGATGQNQPAPVWRSGWSQRRKRSLRCACCAPFLGAWWRWWAGGRAARRSDCRSRLPRYAGAFPAAQEGGADTRA
jgi:hypothetical protein